MTAAIATGTARARARKVIMFPIAFALVAAAWELYKDFGPEQGASVLNMHVLPRASDLAMPHISDMFSRLSEPEVRGNPDSITKVVALATWYSFRVAFAAFVMGTVLGLGLAVLMARFTVIERALMPYLVISQTVPIIVLGPLIMSLLGYASRDYATDYWIGAVLLGVFLAFFPVALGTLRGLQSAQPASLELMDSFAAGWWRTLFKLRFPAAVPFIAPALRIAGAAAVVGVVVSEISLGVPYGVGRKILAYGTQASTDPAKMYVAVFGAAVLGLAMSIIVVGIDRGLMRNRPQETS
ncbi:MAG: putative transporter permease protein [Ilumatobacteraceae bacterium]|nr:putative transporter permease protein [Ilumatobacteraceae bacterium]